MNKKKLRYAILKEIDSGNKKLSEEDFYITAEEFDESVNFLSREDYLKGFIYADNRPRLFDGTAYLTEKGEDYLQENSFFSKSYRGLKEIVSFIKI